MRYFYTDSDGHEVELRIDCVRGGISYFVDATLDVVISAQQVYDDLVNEISMSGSHFAVAHEVITDRYMREHQSVSWESLTKALRQRLVSYLEELRSGSDDNEDDPFYNDGKPWAIQDIFI